MSKFFPSRRLPDKVIGTFDAITKHTKAPISNLYTHEAMNALLQSANKGNFADYADFIASRSRGAAPIGRLDGEKGGSRTSRAVAGRMTA
jgi:hypothetical protein